MSDGLPDSLESWNYELIKNLIDKRIIESNRLDFKFNLPDSDSLTALCCSFANSQGGYIIFGIKDTSSGFVVEGIDYDKEYARKFSEKLRTIPAIIYPVPKFIELPESDKVLVVIHIQASELSPHVSSDIQKMKFWKRTNKGKELMTLEEIREAFQRRLKQQLSRLHTQLETSLSGESNRIKEHKKFYIDRILGHYQVLLRVYNEFNERISNYLDQDNDNTSWLLKQTAEAFINQLDSFYNVAHGDFDEISTIVTSPYLRDKFVFMISESIKFIKYYVTENLVKTFYVQGFLRDKDVLDMWMKTIDQFINTLKEEII